MYSYSYDEHIKHINDERKKESNTILIKEAHLHIYITNRFKI